MSNHDDCDDTCQAKIIEQAVFSAPPDQPEDAALLRVIKQQLSRAYYNGLDHKGWSEYEEAEAAGIVLQLFHAQEQEKVQAAVYGFHEFIIGKDIIRPETDQAFNYGRLHHALDAYIAEQAAQPPAADTTKQDASPFNREIADKLSFEIQDDEIQERDYDH